jgi:superfamily II DNA or RNA helicase
MAAKTPKEDPVEKHRKVYELLKKVRESKTVALKPISMLRSEIVGIDGKVQPFKLRYYQVQAVFHLMSMKRMVLGDATGTGKTPTCIAAFCYTWQKEPTNKVVVITPKSALRQWAAEIDKFATGIQVYLANGGPDERRETYDAFLNHPTGPDDPKAVMVMGYAPLVRDWNQGATRPLKKNGQPDMKKPMSPGLLNGLMQKIDGLTVVYDECFEYHTPIRLADGSERLIGKIVCGREPVSVLSWNWATNSMEPRRVIRWVRNPLRTKGLVKLEFRYANSVIVTRNHKFYRCDGKPTEAGRLRKGSETATFTDTIPSDDQLQIILGGLLGDASVSHPKRSLWGVSFVHGQAQRRYLDFKKGLLASLGTSEISTTPSGYGGSPICRFRLRANPHLCSTLTTHREGRKHPSVEWLSRVGPLGLAIWYGDDGSLQTHTTKEGVVRRRIILNTQGFTYGENELLAGWLRWRWGVQAQISKSGRHWVLYLDAEAADRFLELLPGSLPGVEHKFPGKEPLLLESLDRNPTVGLVRDVVLAKTPWKRAPKVREHLDYVYDLEVEGNHNYIAGGALVSNCTAFKNPSTKTWQVCSELASHANRCYGLTATLLKNNLIEGYAIYKCIYPRVFTTKTKFLDLFCEVKWQPVGGRRKIPIIIGYKNLELFRMRIDPFFLGRPKHEISDELPKLLTRDVRVTLSKAENTKYEEALSGVLALGDGEVRDYEETKTLTALIYCQQTVDSLSLLRFEEGDTIGLELLGEADNVKSLSSKEEAMLDLITGEFDGEKVIVYTRFASLIPRLQELCKKAGVESTAITGKVVDTKTNPARQRAMLEFQDPESDVRVIFISDAGSESINLQAAAAMIFYNAPWSWGNYVQLLGRPIRIGSPHQHVVAIHLVAERPGRAKKTIDHYTLQILQSKKDLIDKVLGEAAVGALNFESEGSFSYELMKSLRDSDAGVSTNRA